MTNELDAGRAIEILEDDELEQENAAMGEQSKMDRQYQDGSWHFVKYEGLFGVCEAPAMYKAKCDAWYSFEFAGIPTRQLEVIGPCVPASLPVGVPDGLAIALFNALEAYEATRDSFPELKDKAIHADQCELLRQHASQMLASPTVKAEQVPTPEFVWVRLLEALAGDNGCPFTASTDDYREAKPALVQLIAAGFFRDDADSLDGDVWTIAAGEQSEAAARFASCADAYAVLSDVLNRVFERPEEDPSLPAAGSAVQAKALRAYDQPTRVAIKMLERTLSPTAMEITAELRRCLGDAQDALSAQQSAPERVSVPDTARLDFMLQKHRKVICEQLPHDNFEVYVEEGFMGDKRYPGVRYSGEWEHGSPEGLEIQREAIDAALLSHGRGEA